MTQPSSSSEAWSAVEIAFAALGRLVLLLDARLQVVRSSPGSGQDFCADPAALEGRPVREILGGEMFDSAESPWNHLQQGDREEGRRAFFHCPQLGTRLVSMSAAKLPPEASSLLHRDACYLVVLRPSDEHPTALSAPTGGMVARSAAMLTIVRLIEALHRSEATILISGETGTGKEIVAHALHDHSPRRKRPFVPVNCAALPPELLESELFGHVRGSFTGATNDRVGRFESAGEGTIFLDEIGDLSLPLQAKLLRVLQERTFERVGESSPRPMKARVIAATNLDLEDAIARQHFREDLYYRLRVVPIHIPALRDRREDIDALARYFVARFGGRMGRAVEVSPDVMTTLEAYDWPGNVRELENALEYAMTFCQGQTLQVEHLPGEITTATGVRAPDSVPAPPAPPVGAPARETDERLRIQSALAECHWNRGRAARALGLSRTTLWRRMKRLGIE